MSQNKLNSLEKMKKALKILLIIILVPLLVLGSIIVIATFNDYQPQEIEIQSENSKPDVIQTEQDLSIVTWNIGYCGLSSEMDFFYDGGKNVRPEKHQTIRNLDDVINTISRFSTYDFIMLQEVDKCSKRSYKINQYDSIGKRFSNFNKNFGKNYDVWFVPKPFLRPMGTVESGLATFSKHLPSTSARYSYPSKYEWPTYLFMLDRCFLINRYPTSDGKELLIINSHNSAYDNGSLRATEMNYLRTFLMSEYKKGNYIIMGGDWNQCPPEFIPEFKNNVFDTNDLIYVDKNFVPADWTWAYDNSMPTNRRVTKPYDAQFSLTTMIDYYLLSPNIEMLSVNIVNLNFQYSDHQPVKLKVKFKGIDKEIDEDL